MLLNYPLRVAIQVARRDLDGICPPYVLVATVVVALLGVLAPAASAAEVPQSLFSAPGHEASPGTAAGELGNPREIASDSKTGAIYVADVDTARINQFTPWGTFVKAFGWDVAPGAVNEQQEVRVRASAGEFKLAFGAETTGDLPFDATGAEVQNALDGLSAITAGGGSVSVGALLGKPDGSTPYVYVVTFDGGPLAGTDVEQLTAANGTTPLNGGTPETELEVRTRADGTPGGTGLEACTTESGCRAGSKGGGPGQISGPSGGLALDAAGDVFVFETGNNRITKFSSAGRFILTFGGDVDETKVEEGKPEAERNLCTAASGDICQAGSKGNGNGQFGKPSVGDLLTIGPTGTLYVADLGRIEEFDTQGHYLGNVPDPEGRWTGKSPNGDGEFFHALDAGQNGELWISLSLAQVSEEVIKVNSSGATICGAKKLFTPISAVATDSFGNAFVLTHGSESGMANEVVELTPSCGLLIPPASGFAATPPNPDLFKRLQATALGTGPACAGSGEPGDVFVANFLPNIVADLDAYGPPPLCFESPPQVPPQISAQFAASVSPHDATLRAEINPRFWTTTRYYVEYGTGKCSEGNCTSKIPLPPGRLLTEQVQSRPLAAAAALSGLSPDTTYHYRYVASTCFAPASGGGCEPGQEVVVKGLGGEPGTDGAESSFTTSPLRPAPKADCPNQAFRTGSSAHLPDCRAFEMVSPLDKAGGDILVLSARDGFPPGLEQSSLTGDQLAYTTYRAFGDAQSAPYFSEYLATRDPGGGWSTHGLNPPREGLSYLAGTQFELPFKAFSPDLSQSWLEQSTAPVLDPGAPGGFTNLYRRDNSTDAYEALIDTVPPHHAEFHAEFTPELQGTSADGSCAVFRANDKLTPEASEALDGGEQNVMQVYETCGGAGLNLVSVLPDGTACEKAASTGTATPESYSGRSSSVTGAVSADGSRVFWTCDPPSSTHTGHLYLRVNATQPQSTLGNTGKCKQPTRACTYQVSIGAGGFVAADPSGSKAIFQEGGALKLFEATEEGNSIVTQVTQIAGKVNGVAGQSTDLVRGVAGQSTDLSRIYFVSEEDLDGSGPAQAGEPTLYLDEKGDVKLVGVSSPARAQVTADGAHLAFMSTVPLTGYDNTDQATGEADAEVFLYDAETEALACVSCNPSGQRPVGQRLNFKEGLLSSFRAAAQISRRSTQFYAPRVLADNGSRLFFQSFEALLPADNNGAEDVYEWQEASSKAQCLEEQGGEQFANGGCLSLISSGESGEESEFVDASPSGDDVFIRTGQSLLPQDPGLIDIYDARVDGGFPQPTSAAQCEGEACQGPYSPPSGPTPASSSFEGAGNVTAPSSKLCAKGKVRRRGRCFAKKHRRPHGQRSRGRAAR